ncbi:transposase [Sphingopyxis sp. LK2115]|uniref:transposase n=1 Tax=Sphingopyxis sp. LK2115 TaxID=2744558 RepID=UPI001CB6BDDE
MSEAQWQRIEPLSPGNACYPRRTASDNRLFVNGVFRVLRSGARWSDLPERCGKPSRRAIASPAGRARASGRECSPCWPATATMAS